MDNFSGPAVEPGEIVLSSSLLADNSQLLTVPVDMIIPNPFQPRKTFSDESLQELAESVKTYGVLQPLLVAQLDGGQFLLIAGERRLRAAKLAGLTSIPVLAGCFNSQEVAEVALIENLQREDLHFLEEAEGYELLLQEFALTQEQMALRVGKKQSTISNKLRLLKLSPAVRSVVREQSLTERHARALLALDGEAAQLSVLQAIVENGLNVRQTEALIESLLTQGAPEVINGRKRIKVIRDVRIFLNTIKKVVGDLKGTGVKVKVKQDVDGNDIVLTMRIPTQAAEKKVKK